MFHPDDSPGIGELMNRQLGLDPGFDIDSDSALIEQARSEIDDDVLRTEAAKHPERGLGKVQPEVAAEVRSEDEGDR